MSDGFHIEGSTTLLHSTVFDVERRTVGHGGSTFERDVAVHRGAVAVLAINDAGQICCIGNNATGTVTSAVLLTPV